MAYGGTSDLLRSVEATRDLRPGELLLAAPATRLDCLEQILQAFRDIADHDDIHQAAERLALALEWIHCETERAAADPIFVDLRLV